MKRPVLSCGLWSPAWSSLGYQASRELLEAFIMCSGAWDSSSGQVWDGRNGEKPVSASSDANIAIAKHVFATNTALQHLKTTSVNYWWVPQYKTKPLSLERPQGFF